MPNEVPNAATSLLCCPERFQLLQVRHPLIGRQFVQQGIRLEFDNLRPVPQLAEVSVYPADHFETTVPELARYRVFAYRRTAIKALQPRRAVRVAERLRPDFAGFPAHPLRNGVERAPKVYDHRIADRGREQQAASDAVRLQVRANDLLELRPERDRTPARARLETAVTVRPERDALSLEADVFDLQAEHFPSTRTRQQERREKRVHEGDDLLVPLPLRRALPPLWRPGPGGFEQQGGLVWL